MSSAKALKKERLDVLLCQNERVETRTKAQALILSGIVYVNGQKADKAGTKYPLDATIEIRGNTLPYVSRGGLKLEAALDAFKIDVHGFICADIGASTGGFTDCLLQHGAIKVYAVDVGYGQLDQKLRQDPRVVVMEEINARYLDSSVFSESVDLMTVDVSFISLKLVLPAVIPMIKAGGQLLALVKPQFEAGRIEISKGEGVITDPVIRQRVLDDIKTVLSDSGFKVLESMDCPVHGPAGNIEFLLWSQKL